jgi:hypothetical protein
MFDLATSRWTTLPGLGSSPPLVTRRHSLFVSPSDDRKRSSCAPPSDNRYVVTGVALGTDVQRNLPDP